MNEEFGWINLYNPDEEDVRRDDGIGFFQWVFAVGTVLALGPYIALFFLAVWIFSKVIEAICSGGSSSPESNLDRWLNSSDDIGKEQ